MSDTGWIVINCGIFVYPTLATTRRESMQKWIGDLSTWDENHKAGIVRCVKVILTEQDSPSTFNGDDDE